MKPGKNPDQFDRDPRIAFFDDHAPTWDDEGPKIAETIQTLAGLRNQLNLGTGQDLLEVGCGTGQITAWLADQVRPGRVTAVDFSTIMLEKARAKGIDADFREADVCRDGLGDHLYDVALCFHCFPHFRDRAAALANLGRALKPAGRLIVLHLASSAEINAFHTGVGGPVASDHLPGEGEWNALLAPAGLRKTALIDREGLFCLNAIRV